MPIYSPDKTDEVAIYDNFRLPDWVDTDIPFDELPPQRQKEILDAYRFSGFRPSMYQVITGTGDCFL